jgi:hypothetical protein
VTIGSRKSTVGIWRRKGGVLPRGFKGFCNHSGLEASRPSEARAKAIRTWEHDTNAHSRRRGTHEVFYFTSINTHFGFRATRHVNLSLLVSTSQGQRLLGKIE